MRVLPLLLLALLFAACDSADLGDNTYPPPGDYPFVGLAELPSVEAGRYNTEGVVQSTSECPEDSICILPDSFLLGQHAQEDPPQIGIRVLAGRPSQLVHGAHYRMSLDVTVMGTLRAYDLVGYARLDGAISRRECLGRRHERIQA